MTTTHDALAASNSLTDLAARILAEHIAIHGLLSESIERAMAAGDLLIEAKAQLKHGEWLPWLADHVTISDRTARLYMRVAKNRAEIEAAKTASIADLTLSEAAALLALSSDVRKLLVFVKECEGLEGEDLIQACIANDVAIIHTPDFDPYAGRSDEERREWKLFALWLIKQGHSVEWVASHLDWQLRGAWTPSQWLGAEGDGWRAQWGTRPVPDALKADWSRWSAERGLMTETEIDAESAALAHNAARNPAPVIAPIRKGRRK